MCVAAFRPGGARILAIIGIVAWTLILFGRSSRTLAALPVFLLIGWLLSTKKRLRWYQIVIVSVATVFLLQLPLALRVNEGGVGILTLGETFLSDPDAIFAAFDPAGIFGNLLFSAPLAGVVGAMRLPTSALWISITPAEGEAAGWSAISPSLRINASTPYNAIGELAAHGWVALIAIALVVGCLIAFAERVASSLPGMVGTIGLLLVMAVSALYAVSVLQYNLRNSTRLVWYLTAGVIALWLIVTIFTKRAESIERAEALATRSPRPA